MLSLTRLSAGPFRLLMIMALFAFAIRAAVPMGFMLSTEQGRWISVTLCSGAGPMQMALNLDTGERRDGDEEPADHKQGQSTHHTVCLFAAAAGVSPPVAEAADPQPSTAFALPRIAFPASVTLGQGLAAPPPWATGPSQSA